MDDRQEDIDNQISENDHAIARCRTAIAERSTPILYKALRLLLERRTMLEVKLSQSEWDI